MFELGLIVGFVLFVLSFLGFGIFLWRVVFSGKTSKTTPVEKEHNYNKFFGIDLNTHHYLGSVTSKYYADTSVIFFVNKQSDQRLYVHYKDGATKVNGFHKHSVFLPLGFEKWRVEEDEIYQYIKEPSQYLRNYMMDKYDVVWNEETKWWVNASESQKYEHAQKTQKEEESDEPKVESTDNNVISVKFGEKKND